MAKYYDNWERLVTVILRREHDRQIALSHSRDFSSFSSTSSTLDLSFHSSSRFEFDDDDDDESHVHPQAIFDHTDWRVSMAAILWTMMLPLNEQEVVWRLASLRFFVDEMTGKNCYLLGVPYLKIPEKSVVKKYPHPESRFSEVVELKYARNLCIEATIKKQMLSPETLYEAYLVFGFPEKQDHELRIGREDITSVRWTEIKMESFYVGVEGDGEVEVQFTGANDFWEAQWLGTDPYWRSRLIIEGIEIRPLITQGMEI